MAIGGVGGPQGPQNNPKVSNEQNIDKQVAEYKNSIFGQCDTDKSGKLDANNKNAENEVKTFNTMVQNFIAKITGGNQVNQTQGVEQTGTQADVTAATNEPTSSAGAAPKFDDNGNLISDVTHNEDGSKTIKAGDETIQVSQKGDSISVKNEDGKNVSLTKTPDGGYEFKDEDGKVHKFDKDMNPQT